MFSRNLVKYFILIIFVLFAGSIFIVHSTDFKRNSGTIDKNKLQFPLSSQSYVTHVPILIQSDAGFGNYNFSGAGTREAPFLIEGYNITSYGAFSMALDISNTNAFFVINNCIAYTDYIGVALSDVKSGSSKVIGNRIYSLTGDGGGILLGHMENCTIIANIVTNFMQGIHLNYVDGCLILDNYIDDINYQGINIRYSDSNNITFNQISNAKEHGIALVGTSSNNVIHHNILEGNIWSDTYNIDGINKGRPTSQGYDEGSQNTWYDSENEYGNMWSDYFGIGSYQIDGPANAIDLYPKHTTGLTLFCIIIFTTSIIIGLGVVLIIYRFYYKKRKNTEI